MTTNAELSKQVVDYLNSSFGNSTYLEINGFLKSKGFVTRDAPCAYMPDETGSYYLDSSGIPAYAENDPAFNKGLWQAYYNKQLCNGYFCVEPEFRCPNPYYARSQQRFSYVPVQSDNWIEKKVSELAPFAWVAASVAASVFVGPLAGIAVKSGSGLDSGKSINQVALSAGKSAIKGQIPGVVDGLIFTDSLSVADPANFNIFASPSFDSSALTNPVLSPNLETVTFGVSSPVLDITPLQATPMNDFLDFEIPADAAPDNYAQAFDNVDFSSGESASVFSDAQNVSFGFNQILVGQGATAAGFDTASIDNSGLVITDPGTVTLNGTPDITVSDFGSIPYANPPASGSIFTASNLKVAANIGAQVANAILPTVNGGGAKYSTATSGISASGKNSLPGLSAQKEVKVNTVGQLQSSRDIKTVFSPNTFIAAVLAAIVIFAARGKK